MSSLLVMVLSGAWGAAKSIGEFSVGGAPNGPGFGPTGLGSGGAGSGSPGGPGGDDPSSGGPGGSDGDGSGGPGGGGSGDGGGDGSSGGDGDGGDGDGGDGGESGDWQLGGGDEPYDHEEGLPSPDDSALDTLDRTLWDTLKNLLDVGTGISALEVGPGVYKAAGEAKRRERKINDLLNQDHRGDRHLRQPQR